MASMPPAVLGSGATLIAENAAQLVIYRDEGRL
jgi:hypothetical protein